MHEETAQDPPKEASKKAPSTAADAFTNPTVSMVAHGKETQCLEAKAADIIRDIRSPRWQKQVERIREIYVRVLAETGKAKMAKDAVSDLKVQLPGVLWSGSFTTRAGSVPLDDKLIAHSGLLCADLDDLGARMAEVRAALLTSPYLWALFTSPTGAGLKAVFRVEDDATKHLASFYAVQAHVRALCGAEIDTDCKDVTRLCFAGYDPDAPIKRDALELPPLLVAPDLSRILQAAPNSAIVLQSPHVYRPDGTLPDAVALLLAASVGAGQRNKAAFLIACQLRDAGMTEAEAEKLIREFAARCNPPMLEGEAMTALRSAYARAARDPAPRAKTASGGVHAESLQSLSALPRYSPPPLGLLPGALRDFVEAASSALMVDVSYLFLPLLSAMGTAIGNSRIVQLKDGFTQPAIIWSGIIGSSGSKKSPAMESATLALREYERALVRENKGAQVAFDTIMAEWESQPRESRGAKPTPPTSRTVLMDDLTLASLATILSENPRGVCVAKDELSHWFSSFDQYTNSPGADVSRWLSLHTGVLFALDRKTNRERCRIFNPRVSIAGGIQPKTLQRCLTPDFFDRGLPARFLFAYPPSRQDQWAETTVRENVRNAMVEVFKDLFRLQPGHNEFGDVSPQVVKLCPEAKSMFVDFYNTVGASAVDADEREEAAWNKITGYCARLSLLGQMARDGAAEVITADTMSAAVELARWFGDENRRIYTLIAEGEASASLRRLAEFIARRGGNATVRDIITDYRPLKNKTELAEAQLNQLALAKLGEWLPMLSTPKGGRPTRPFRLTAHEVTGRLRLQNHEFTDGNGGIADADRGNAFENEPQPDPAQTDPVYV